MIAPYFLHMSHLLISYPFVWQSMYWSLMNRYDYPVSATQMVLSSYFLTLVGSKCRYEEWDDLNFTFGLIKILPFGDKCDILDMLKHPDLTQILEFMPLGDPRCPIYNVMSSKMLSKILLMLPFIRKDLSELLQSSIQLMACHRDTKKRQKSSFATEP